jgi:hypothetical protein
MRIVNTTTIEIRSVIIEKKLTKKNDNSDRVSFSEAEINSLRPTDMVLFTVSASDGSSLCESQTTGAELLRQARKASKHIGKGSYTREVNFYLVKFR